MVDQNEYDEMQAGLAAEDEKAQAERDSAEDEALSLENNNGLPA